MTLAMTATERFVEMRDGQTPASGSGLRSRLEEASAALSAVKKSSTVFDPVVHAVLMNRNRSGRKLEECPIAMSESSQSGP